MVDQVDTKNQNYQYLEEECQNFEGNVMSSLHLTDLNSVRKDNLPTKENLENILLDLMLEHSIDCSKPDSKKLTVIQLTSTVLATLQARNMIVHPNWIPASARKKYLDDDNNCEKFIKEVSGVGDAVTRQIINRAHSEGMKNDLLGLYRGLKHQGVFWLSKEN